MCACVRAAEAMAVCEEWAGFTLRGRWNPRPRPSYAAFLVMRSDTPWRHLPAHALAVPPQVDSPVALCVCRLTNPVFTRRLCSPPQGSTTWMKSQQKWCRTSSSSGCKFVASVWLHPAWSLSATLFGTMACQGIKLIDQSDGRQQCV